MSPHTKFLRYVLDFPSLVPHVADEGGALLDEFINPRLHVPRVIGTDVVRLRVFAIVRGSRPTRHVRNSRETGDRKGKSLKSRNELTKRALKTVSGNTVVAEPFM